MKNIKNKESRSLVVVIIVIIIVLIFLIFKSLFIQKEICGLKVMGKNYDVSFCNLSCSTDNDCRFTCGCGAINKNETCQDEGTIYDCVNHQVKCEENKCISGEENINSQVECSGSCRCMEKCNEQGPTYFIPSEEGFLECSINSINKICCCSGV